MIIYDLSDGEDERLPPRINKPKKEKTMSNKKSMIDHVKGFVQERPFISLFAVCLLSVGANEYSQSNPLEPQPLTQYRVVYEHSKDRNEACSNQDGYFWYAEELDDGILFDTWESMRWCGTSEKQAKDIAEKTIKRRLETEKSKQRVYQAYMTKEDVVRFETANKAVK